MHQDQSRLHLFFRLGFFLRICLLLTRLCMVCLFLLKLGRLQYLRLQLRLW